MMNQDYIIANNAVYKGNIDQLYSLIILAKLSSNTGAIFCSNNYPCDACQKYSADISVTNKSE